MASHWNNIMKAAFLEGREAKSAYCNPHWKSYPTPSSNEDESKARHWLGGYLSKFIQGNNNETTA